MKRRGHAEDVVRKVVYENPLAFWRLSNRWQEWEAAPAVKAKDEKKAKPAVVRS
jgi:hypothetical protein